MRNRPIDPQVKRAMDEARALPACAAQVAWFERAANLAEAGGDLDAAWNARCNILESSAVYRSIRFDNLFMNLAWCLAMSDRDPERFSAHRILWQYKWVATAAPEYAVIPRQVLFSLVEDLEARFLKHSWGPRAGVHKRLEVLFELGEFDQALALISKWQSLKRDRGSDCNACELNTVASMFADTGRLEEALKVARPLVSGKETCSTVPQSTFASLLDHLVAAGDFRQAHDFFTRGCKQVSTMGVEGVQYAGPFLAFAACRGDMPQVEAILRARFADGCQLPSDRKRLTWFTHAAAALARLADDGVDTLDLPLVGGISDNPGEALALVASRCHSIAQEHARRLDLRNGNASASAWVQARSHLWRHARIPPKAGKAS